MNLLEEALHYPLQKQLPDWGRSLELAPGVRWLRMALPFALDHINLWLLRDCLNGREGWTVVDCCVDRPESRAQWHAVIEQELQGLPVLRVLATHMHPDHLGLAHWLCERFAAPRPWQQAGMNLPPRQDSRVNDFAAMWPAAAPTAPLTAQEPPPAWAPACSWAVTRWSSVCVWRVRRACVRTVCACSWWTTTASTSACWSVGCRRTACMCNV